MQRNLSRTLVPTLLLVLLMVLGYQLLSSMDLQVQQKTTWPQAKALIASGDIERVEIRRSLIVLQQGASDSERPVDIKVPRVHADDDGLIDALESAQVPYVAVDESGCDAASARLAARSPGSRLRGSRCRVRSGAV